jgi:hypothetical protein
MKRISGGFYLAIDPNAATIFPHFSLDRSRVCEIGLDQRTKF